MRFDRDSIERFVFQSYGFDPERMRLELNYRLDDIGFTETIEFPGGSLAGVDEAALDRAFHLLHLLAGISYYKAALPPVIEIATRLPSPAMAAFLEQTYCHGLGEFAWTNHISIEGKTHFPSADLTVDVPPAGDALPGYVVPLGGGKDSLVSCELLSQASVSFRTIDVGGSRLIRQVARAVGKSHLSIRRQLDRRLFDLNDQGAYNGHVPISAILAGVMVCGGLLYRYGNVVMSNERSADSGNFVLDSGFVVNHQYSKSLEFERDFGELVDREVVPGFRYFSLLRGWSELAVARRFAELSGYHREFSSCNRNFRINDARPLGRWCCDCPKCRFVFLALAPFLTVDALTEIFGLNLMDDPDQIAGYRALLGLGADKPFECVGEIEESRAAMAALIDDPEWNGWPVVQHFAGAPELRGARLEPLLQISRQDRIPQSLRRLLDAA